MKRLARAPNIALATLWADRLSQAGFAASVQRYYLSGIAGELPPDQCQPEIWLADAAQLEAAQALLNELQNPPQHRWQCACGELVEGGFEQCWQCGAAM
jgi:Putative prokaryotic signal transducing protein